MIVSSILLVFLTLLTFIFSLVSLPAAPAVFVNAFSVVLPWLLTPAAIIKEYVGAAFFDALIVMILASFLLLPTIHFGIWIYNKFRGSGG